MTAADYLDQHWGPHSVWRRLGLPHHQARLRKCAERADGFSFADVGCAFGHSTTIMAGFHSGFWTGIEFSLDAIGKAFALFPAGDWLFIESVDALAEVRGAFDSVVCSEVIEHVENDVLLAERVIGAARKRAVFTTPRIRVKDPGHVRLYSEKSLGELFARWPHRVSTEGRFFFVEVEARP